MQLICEQGPKVATLPRSTGKEQIASAYSSGVSGLTPAQPAARAHRGTPTASAPCNRLALSSHLQGRLALTDCMIMRIEKTAMLRALHSRHAFSDMFVEYLLSRNIRYQEDLVDQLFNSSEKRLARILLLFAGFGKNGIGEKTAIPKISQETLAEMVGTTRPRVTFFMNKFRKMGFIDYNGGIEVHRSLLNVVLLD